MSLNMNRFTRLAEEVVYASHKIVTDAGQQRLEVEHLLLALLRHKEGLLPQVFEQIEIDRKLLIADLTQYLQGLKSVKSNNENVFISYSCEQMIRKAELEADRMRDEYLNPEHLLLGILMHTGTEAASFLKLRKVEFQATLKAVTDLRKGKRIKDREDETNEGGMISEFCQDIVELARRNKFDPVIGRDEEVRRVIQVLSRRTKNNPILIGEPGVGKTAIIEGLAQRIYLGDVPDSMKKSKILSLDLAGMVAGAKYRGEFEDRLKGLLNEIENSDENNILFIDEIHTLVGAGASEGALDASNMLKPLLARGELRCVGATTTKEFKKSIEKDPALARRFQQVLVSEPSVHDCVTILRGLKGKYEVHHGVRIKDSAIIAAAKLSDRYIPDRFLPDKAIDLIDEAASKIRIEIDSLPTVIDQIDRRILQLEIEKKALQKEDDEHSQKRLDVINKELEEQQSQSDTLKKRWQNERKAIQKIQSLKEEIERGKQEELEAQRSGNLELAAKLKYGTLDDLEKELSAAHQMLGQPEQGRLLKEEIDAEDIAAIVSHSTGIPVSKMMEGEQEKLLNMERTLSEKIVGQKQALIAVANAIRRARTGIQDPDRPLGSFIFMGSTGVGKTEMAKVLAGFLFDDAKAMIRFDMSEYMEKHTVSRLLGPPPGYAGFDEGGILTEAVHRRPYSVVLFDEIEKAHLDVTNILLQILDEGILTDARGFKVDFKNTIVILTTNLGGEVILKAHAEGKKLTEAINRKILLTHFRPEILNRLDEIIVFAPLQLDHIVQLVELQLKALQKRLLENDTKLFVTKEAQRFLAEKGFDAEFGARPLKRVIQRELEDVLAYKILDGTIKPGDCIEVRTQNNLLSFHRIKASTKD
ncbi:MAG: type VI secretion system ATPase TssH [SAR324 cluster bacterium]|uniref:Type VI secretion system ATPase TssH n=1 Tax=SAR324 cluster bacterium TaxID=2024889 RepID=A0A2A4TBT2_9DELT|nr:MAG: type VI secretion system ATPase TssH [SAR324 cluster bacterium]